MGIAFFKALVKGKEVAYPMEKFQYTYSEDSNDIALITINTKDPNFGDDPIFFDNTRWVLLWGFIGGVSKQRIVYVQDIKAEFGKSGRKVIVELCEQGITMKQIKAKKMFGTLEQPADVVMVAAQLGQEVGLNVLIMGSKQNSNEGAIEIAPQDTVMAKWLFLPFSGVTQWDGNSLNGPLANQPTNVVDSAITETLTELVNSDNKPSVDSVLFADYQNFLNQGRDTLNRNGLSPLTQYVGKVSANKTHGQVVDEMAKYDGLVAETRDEDLIIKRRNFNKPPYRSYVYGKDEELFSFIPETKHRTTAGAAINTLFSLWDASNKQFTQGMTDLTNTLKKPIANLSQYMKESGYVPSTEVIKLVVDANNPKIQQLKTQYNQILTSGSDSTGDDLSKLNALNDIKLGIAELSNPQSDVNTQAARDLAAGLVMNPTTPNVQHVADVLENASTGGRLSSGADVDETRVIKANKKEITVGRLRREYTAVIQTLTNQMHDPTARTDSDAYKKAYNALEDSNLQMNAATGHFWGDINHETGIIITVLGLGKRYSSNYYIIKSTHTLESNGGYTVSDEFCTQGSNVKMANNNKNLIETNRFINKEIGKQQAGANSKGVTGETNQR